MKKTASFNCLSSLVVTPALAIFRLAKAGLQQFLQQNHVALEWLELGVLAHWSFHFFSLGLLKALWQHWDRSSVICYWQMRTLKLQKMEWVTCPRPHIARVQIHVCSDAKDFPLCPHWIPSLTGGDLESRGWKSPEEWFSWRISQNHSMTTATQRSTFEIGTY